MSYLIHKTSNSTVRKVKTPKIQIISNLVGALSLGLFATFISLRLSYMAVLLVLIQLILLNICIINYSTNKFLSLVNLMLGLFPLGYIYCVLNYSLLPITTHLLYFLLVGNVSVRFVYGLVDGIVVNRKKRIR